MIGYRLKQLREEKGLKQSELGKELSMSASSIGMYETNRREPDDETKFKIAKYFDVSVAYLMGETDERIDLPAIKQAMNDDAFIAFYEGYKDLDEDDRETARAIIDSLKKRKEEKNKKK